MESLKAECSACRGTGLYRGMAESAGTAVVCLRCDGTGCEEIQYRPFSGRNRRNDVERVCRSAGSTILACGPVGQSITYEQFVAGEMPSR